MNEKSDSSVSVDVYRVGSIRDLQYIVPVV